MHPAERDRPKDGPFLVGDLRFLQMIFGALFCIVEA